MTEADQAIRVVIFEDEDFWVELAQEELKALGCVIVAVIRNMAQAEQVIPTLAQQNIQYALIDGNLSKNASGGYDGRSIHEQLKQAAPEIKTIGYSAVDQAYVDHQLGKQGMAKKRLGKIIKPQNR